MNNQRPYAQPMARPSNQAGPTIRAGLSVQELKAMTAMRVAHDSDSPNPGINPRDVTNAGPYRNPASSYQTATPQQLQAAGIAPVVINERPAARQQKPAAQGAYSSYASPSAYGEQDVVGQNRPYSYDDVRGGPASAANTSSYAKASSTAGVTPALSAYHQQILPNRSSGPQINSVEDVKEMTRLRMLMTEREAFFGGNPEQNNNISSHSSGGPHSDFDGPGFEDMQASRYAARSTDSFDSYDYPGVGIDAHARRGGGGGLQQSHAQSPLVGGLSAPSQQQQNKSLYAPPSQQHQLYEYGSNPGSAGSSSKLSQSSSVGGLGLGLGLSTSQRSGLSDLSSPLGGPLSSPSYGSSLRPNVGGSRSQVSLGLGLAGSSVVGRRAVGAPLAPVDRLQQGHGGFNGIERGLMLNAQLTGHAHHGHGHGLGLGLSGSGIDRVEQSLNGLGSLSGHSLGSSGSASYHDDLLPPAFGHGHHGPGASNSARLTSGAGTGLSPTTHSSRSSSNSYMNGNNNNNNNSNSNNQSGNNSFLYGSNNSSGRDVSLSALLGESNHGHSHAHSNNTNNHNNNHNSHGNSAYSQFGSEPHTPLDLDLTERDTSNLTSLTNLYDLLSDPLGTRQSNASTNTNNILSTLNSMNGHNASSLHTSSSSSATATISALRLDITSSPQKVVLGPLSGVSPSPSSTSNTSSNTPSHSSNGVPSVEHRVSPRMLAPLQESPTSSTSSHKELRERDREASARELLPHTHSAKDLPLQGSGAVPGVRKLSHVGKAATYNDAVSTSGKDKDRRGVVVLPELETSPTKLPPTAARSAFTEHASSSNNNNSNNNTSSSYNSDLALGIASPENSSSDNRTGRHGANLSLGSASPTPGSASNKRFPLIKASTTSRIPSEMSPGTKSPSHKMLFKGSNNNNNNKNYDYTPPGTALDRAASDSTNMNFLASEMAEMVLDTPYKPGSGPRHTHSRDNSADLSRLLAAINNSGSDVGDNSLPSVTSKSFKRIPSISSFLGFD